MAEKLYSTVDLAKLKGVTLAAVRAAVYNKKLKPLTRINGIRTYVFGEEEATKYLKMQPGRRKNGRRKNGKG